MSNPYVEIPLNFPKFLLISADLLFSAVVQAVPDGPNFASKFQTTETGIDVILSAVHITAHQDSLVNLMMFANTLQDMQ